MKSLKFILLLVLVLSGVVAYFFTPLQGILTPEKLTAFLQSARETWWAPVLVILVYGIGGVIALPGSVLSLAIGAVYGLMPGFFYNLIAANLAAWLGFFSARTLGRGFVERFLATGKLKEFDDKAAAHGFRFVFYLRLVPIFPFNAVNFGAGFSKIRFRDYALASLLGMLPGTFVYTYFAASILSGAVEAKTEAYLHLAVSGVLFVLLSLIPVFYRRRGL
ncbi:MAG TPA: TVP38/TMEM64 family protein [bacterium]|nr:TVP38/TMEM64 family protein [bacterium]